MPPRFDAKNSSDRVFVTAVLVVAAIDHESVGLPIDQVGEELTKALLPCRFGSSAVRVHVDDNFHGPAGDFVGKHTPSCGFLVLEVQFALTGKQERADLCAKIADDSRFDYRGDNQIQTAALRLVNEGVDRHGVSARRIP